MSVLIATPYTRPHYGKYVRSLIFTERLGGFSYKDVFDLPVDEARNYLVDCLKMGDEKFILFADNDASWHGGAVVRLMEHDLPVVCGCMYTPDVPPLPTMGTFIGNSREGKTYYLFSQIAKDLIQYCRDQEVEELESNDYLFPEPHLYEIDGSGMHFTMIRRDVIEALTPPYFVHRGNSGAGEDFYFSKKVRDAGFPYYCDFSVQTGHIVGERKDLGLKELLYISKRMPIEDLVEDGAAWTLSA